MGVKITLEYESSLMSTFTLAYFNQKSIGYLIRRTFNIKTPMVAYTLSAFTLAYFFQNPWDFYYFFAHGRKNDVQTTHG